MSTLALYLSGRGRICYLPLIFANLVYYFKLIARTVEHELNAKPPTVFSHMSDQQWRDIGFTKVDVTLAEYGIKPRNRGYRVV